MTIVGTFNKDSLISNYKPTYINAIVASTAINASLIVSPPYREDVVVYMDYTPRSTVPTVVNGTCYFNTADCVLYVAINGQWINNNERLGSRDDGFIYITGESNKKWYTYNPSTKSMTLISSMNAWNHVYIKLETTNSAPSNPTLGMYYYSTAANSLYYYNGYGWITPMLKSYFELYHVWFAFNGRLHYYNSTTDALILCYRSGKLFYESDSAVWSMINNIGYQTPTYTKDYNWSSDSAHQITARCKWCSETNYSDSDLVYIPEQGTYNDDFTFPDKVQGRNGTGINSSVTITSTLNRYSRVGDEATFKFQCTPNSTYTASLLIPVNAPSKYACEQYGVRWLIGYGNEPSVSYPDFFSLEKAVNEGYVSITNVNTSTYNQSELSIKFLKKGTYYVYAYCKYCKVSGGLVVTAKLTKPTHQGNNYILVYYDNNPSLTVQTITPNPDVYPPPYTITLRDTTNVLQVPQKTTDLDACDTANPEVWSITNNGTVDVYYPITTGGDKSHTYNGYGPYRPSLTITDMEGNSKTGYATFAPSKTGRKYTPAGWTSPIRLGYNGTYYYAVEGQTVTIRLDQQGVNVPAMVTLEASVAGEPLPEVTWTYTLISVSPTQSGSITGTYAELSLIQGGNADYAGTGIYTIDCSVLGTWQRFTVVVGAETVATEADKTMEDFGLIVLNDVNLPIDYCKQHTCPQYTTKWQDSDTVQFELPINYKYAEYLQEGDRFIFGHFGAKLFTVTYRQQSDNAITITGTCVFPSRVAITSTRSQANDGYDVQTASAEALIRYFINASLKDPYSTAQPRTANFLPHGTCNNYGGSVTYSARYENVQDIVNEICNTSGVGYSVGIRAMADGSIDKCQIWIKQGINRIYGTNIAIIFSEALKNMRIVSDQSALCPNVAIGAGNGTGNYRDYTYYNIAGSTPSDSGFDRREVFVDAGDAVDADEIKRMSVLELKTAKQLSIKIQVLPKCQWEYGTQYDVGDMVTLVHPTRGQLDLQIFSAEHVRRATGDELYLNLGSRSLTAPALIGKVSAANTYARK